MSHITAAGHGDPLLPPREPDWDRPTDAAAEDAWYAAWAKSPNNPKNKPPTDDSERAAA